MKSDFAMRELFGFHSHSADNTHVKIQWLFVFSDIKSN